MTEPDFEAFTRALPERLAYGIEALAAHPDLRLVLVDLGDVALEWVMRAYPIRGGEEGVARILDDLARGRWEWFEGDRFILGDGLELATGPMPPSAGADAGGGHEPEWEKEVQVAVERALDAAAAAAAVSSGAICGERAAILFLVGFEDAPVHVGTLKPEGWVPSRLQSTSPPGPEPAT